MTTHEIKAGMQCICGVMLYPASNARVDLIGALDQHRREEAEIERYYADNTPPTERMMICAKCGEIVNFANTDKHSRTHK